MLWIKLQMKLTQFSSKPLGGSSINGLLKVSERGKSEQKLVSEI
jgi:hypothetical protein